MCAVFFFSPFLYPSLRSSPTPFPQLQTMLAKYQSPVEADGILKVQQELDETKIVLVRVYFFVQHLPLPTHPPPPSPAQSPRIGAEARREAGRACSQVGQAVRLGAWLPEDSS